MAGGYTLQSQMSHLGKYAAIRHIVAELLYRWEPAFHEGKRQTVLEDAHGGGAVGMRNTWVFRYTHGTAMQRLQIQNDMRRQRNVRGCCCDQRVCSEVRVGAQTRSQNEVDYAAAGDYNELPRQAAEQRNEALVPASLDDNTKCLE
jgi:hypothetical protein